VIDTDAQRISVAVVAMTAWIVTFE